MIEKHLRGEGRYAVLSFDKPGSAANTLDEAMLHELERQLDDLSRDPTIQGVILTSAKPQIFMAGADLSLFRDITPERLESWLELGQRVFNQLADMSIPTVAAIHGACIGGGYELALACDGRIATEDAATRIGLPETKLGILPAWGGSTRLPRLVGIPAALDVILKGRIVSARRAKKLGLVDRLAPKERLLEAAVAVLEGRGEIRPLRKAHTSIFQRPINKAVATAIGGRARAEIMSKTRGDYPSMIRALEVIIAGAGESDRAASLARERLAVMELAQGVVAKNLFHVLTLQEGARHQLRKEAEGRSEIDHAGVFGAGVMGAGITQAMSAKGVRVLLRDVDAERVGGGMARIYKIYNDAVKHHLLTSKEAREGIDRISPADGPVPMKRLEVIVEAIVEQKEAKKALFQSLEKEIGPEVVLASNTSAIPLHEISEGLQHPERVIGLHFFNPVAKMKLVEVVVPDRVSELTRRRALALVARLGKLPILVRDKPGFLVNRILVPYLLEAARLAEGGMGVAEIDTTMLDFGMPMGPLQLIDEVGLDIALEVGRRLEIAYPDRVAVPRLLNNMLSAGMLGRKNGKGFYLYPSGKEPRVNPDIGACRPEDVPALEGQEHARQRMVCRMVDEAASCLEEGVVDSPEAVDLGMILGAGFPAFRGGLLRYADSIGVAQLVAEMEAIHLTPGKSLSERARLERSFYENTTGSH